jgi:hypothetical protein
MSEPFAMYPRASTRHTQPRVRQRPAKPKAANVTTVKLSESQVGLYSQ